MRPPMATPIRHLAILAVSLTLAAPAAAMTTGTPARPNASASDVVEASNDVCGYYTIIASGGNRNSIRRTAGRAGARVVDTNRVSNFRGGLFAAVFGPDSRNAARDVASRMRSRGYRDAYVKWGCE